MITNSEIGEFIQKIETWRFLSIEEQENVISKSLERYYYKARTELIPNAVGWLVSAADKIKHEELRERKKRNREFGRWCEPRCSDRRMNGAARDRCTMTARVDASPLDAELEIAFRRELKTLRQIERKIVELCVFDGLYPAEAGRLLSLGRSTTKSCLERALKKLQMNSTLRVLFGLEARVAG